MAPSKVNIPKIKKQFDNRTDLKRYLKDLTEFTKRGAEETKEGTEIPKYLYNQIKTKQRRLSYNINRQIKLMNTKKVTNYGKRQVQTIGSYDDIQLKNLIAKQKKLLNVKLSTLEPLQLLELSTKLTSNTRTDRNTIFKNNFLKMLNDNAQTYGIDSSIMNEIKRKMKQLSPSDFFELSITEQSIKEIIHHYNEIGKQGFENYRKNNLSDIQDVYTNVYENLDLIVDEYLNG